MLTSDCETDPVEATLKQTCHSPLSQTSTAPCSPQSNFRLTDEESSPERTWPGSPWSSCSQRWPIADEPGIFMLPDPLDLEKEVRSFVPRRPRHMRRTLAARAIRSCRNSGHPKSPIGQETLIMLDVDGVLNVAVCDGKAHPLALDKENIARVERMDTSSTSTSSAAKALSFLCSQRAGGDDQTYAELCHDSTDFVDTFVERLVKLIQAAGPSTTVVLTSTWRLPCHAIKLAALEKAISKKMRRTFNFSVRTAAHEKAGPEGRLHGIARFIRDHCAEKAEALKSLRVLVLEDFHVHPMGCWSCDGQLMASSADVERSLQSCVPDAIAPSVKLLHTYSEWKLQDGAPIQVGSGLTLDHFRCAMGFLQDEASPLRLRISTVYGASHLLRQTPAD